GKIRMTRSEGANLDRVLLIEHRTGDVDDAATCLHQRRGAVEDLGLLLLPLLQGAGAHAPFGIRIAPPGASAGARRVDQHKVATASKVVDLAADRLRCAHLHVTGTRAS